MMKGELVRYVDVFGGILVKNANALRNIVFFTVLYLYGDQ